ARVVHPAGVGGGGVGGGQGCGAAVGGEVDDVVEVADEPAREVHRLEGRALTAVAGPRAEGRVHGEQRAAVVGLQVELEVLVPQVAPGPVYRLEREPVRVRQAGRFHKRGVRLVGAGTVSRHRRDNHEVIGVVVLEVAGVAG